jgi:crossover junction endodeoxyribonuclease RuvC
MLSQTIVLGIDPGIATTGYGLIEKTGNKNKIITYGTITTEPKTPLADRLVILAAGLKDLINKYQPTLSAVEELFYCNNAKTALIVGQARGVILLTLSQHNLKPESYTPLQIKSAVCGYGKAPKMQVQLMVQRLLNLAQIPKPDDAADALAIAICHSHSYRLKSVSL